MIFCLSSGIPIPVSVTTNWSQIKPPRDAIFASSGSRSTLTKTSPWSVNLIALPTRFIRICRNRVESPRSTSGTRIET